MGCVFPDTENTSISMAESKLCCGCSKLPFLINMPNSINFFFCRSLLMIVKEEAEALIGMKICA